MTQCVDFGLRIFGEEYERRVVQLYSRAPPMPDKKQDRELRRRGLNLQIDHCLGVDFPLARREQPFEVQCGLDQVGPVSLLRYALGRMMPSFLVGHLSQYY